MKHGFSFDTDLCVSCNACVMACTLENTFQTRTRSIYTFNSSVSSKLGVFNLSLACNHCEKPACLTGCPARAYSRDNATGVIIHDPESCMGCSYCTWRCPFDAPKMNLDKGQIEKCSFCVHRLAEGIDPACVTACPTGALKHKVTDETIADFPLLPVTDFKPSLQVTGKDIDFVPVIFPPEDEEVTDEIKKPEKVLRKEWSLIAFSTLIAIAGGFTVAEFFGGGFLKKLFIPVILFCAMVISFAHLGKFTKSWRALMNISLSPLSREILLISVFMLLSFTGLFYQTPALEILLVLAALLSLAAVDIVYLSVDRSLAVLTHSGQTLFSGLLIAAYFSSSVKAFALLTFLAVASAVFRKGTAVNSMTGIILFSIRQICLILPLVLMTIKSEQNAVFGNVIVLAGIVADRALFYLDFRPENIRHYIAKLVTDNYEKARSKQFPNSDIS